MFSNDRAEGAPQGERPPMAAPAPRSEAPRQDAPAGDMPILAPRRPLPSTVDNDSEPRHNHVSEAPASAPEGASNDPLFAQNEGPSQRKINEAG